VSGRRTDGTTTALSGIRVDVKAGASVVASATTNATGSYAIPVPDGTYDVNFVPPDASVYESFTQAGFVVPASGDLDVVLTPKDALRVSGTVRKANGSPAGPVKVRIHGPSESTQTTGLDGAYIAAVAPGEYTFELSDDGSAHAGLPARWSLGLTAKSINADRTLLDFTLPPVYTLTTRVLHADGATFEGAVVSGFELAVATTEVATGVLTTAASVSSPPAATTGAGGLARFDVFGSTAGDGEIAAGPNNPRTPFHIPAITKDTTLSIRADGSANPIVSQVGGFVRSALGQALSGVQVTARGASVVSQNTAPNGSYTTTLTPGSYAFELNARNIQQPGLPKDWTLPVNATTVLADRTIDYQLPPVHTLTVKVLGDENAPVGGVVVTGTDGGSALDVPVAPTVLSPGLTSTASGRSRPVAATTNGSGEATFRVFTSTAGHGIVRAGPDNPQTPFDIPEISGDRTVVVHVTPPPTRTLHGVVRSAGGAPVNGVQVSVGSGSARTGPNGSYTIGGIAPDSYAVFLSGSGPSGYPQTWQLRSAPVAIESDREVDWALPAVHALTVQVLDPDGHAVDGAAIGTGSGSALVIPSGQAELAPGVLSDAGFSSSTQVTDAAGIATYRVIAGTATAGRVRPLSLFAPQSFDVPAMSQDKTVTVSVVPIQTRTLHGYVRSAAGTGVGGVQIGVGSASARTDQDGSYTINGIPPDRYAVFLSGTSLAGYPQSWQLRSAPIDIESDREVDWALPAVQTLTMEVRDQDGDPLEGASIGTGTGTGLAIPSAQAEIAPGVLSDSGFSSSTKTTNPEGIATYRVFDSMASTTHVTPLGHRYLSKDAAVSAMTHDTRVVVRFTSADENHSPDPGPPPLPRGLSGHVVGRSTAGVTGPLGNVRVDIRHSGVTIATGTTDAEGDYAIGVVDDTYDVRFTPPEASLYAPLTQFDVTIARAARADVVLTPNDSLRLSGIVRSANGRRLSGVHVTVSGPQSASLTTAADGSYTGAVTPGTYTFRLSGGASPELDLPPSWSLAPGASSIQADSVIDFTCLPSMRSQSTSWTRTIGRCRASRS
jgi:hypothetical protein